MIRAEWCIFCAQAHPSRHTGAAGHYEGDPACVPCWQAQSRQGTIGEWIPFGPAPVRVPMPSMSARATKRKGLQVRVRPGDTVPMARLQTITTATGEEVQCTPGAVMGPEMIDPHQRNPGETSMPNESPTARGGRSPLTEEQRTAILIAPPDESHESVARRVGVSGVTVGKIRNAARSATEAPPVAMTEEVTEQDNADGEPCVDCGRSCLDHTAGTSCLGYRTAEDKAEEDRHAREQALRRDKASESHAKDAVPVPRAVIPLYVDDECAVALFARLPLELKAKALCTVIQPLLLG